MYYTVYKDFFEFPLLILSDKDAEDISVWEQDWTEEDIYHADQHSVLITLGAASTGYMIDDPMTIFVSQTIDLGRETNLNLKLEDLDTLLFNGVLKLGKNKTLNIGIQSEIELDYPDIELSIWGNKDTTSRKDLYIEIEPAPTLNKS